ncbi:MAG: multicopper oxidase family protein [Methyloligellaceae bacterium]
MRPRVLNAADDWVRWSDASPSAQGWKMMYLSRSAPKNRVREALRARENRAEIVRALSQGQITRRDLMKWGLLSTTGLLAAKHGFSPFAKSAYAGDDIPTGTPPSPLFGVDPDAFEQPLPRLIVQKPRKLKQFVNPATGELEAQFKNANLGEPNAKRLSWHTEFSAAGGADFLNPRTGVGPMEGRPPGEYFAHQRWEEFFPEQAYVMSLGRIKGNTRFHPDFPAQKANSVWTFNKGRFKRGKLPPPLIKVRYGEPVILRNYNNTPTNRARNRGFGRNEFATHNHNAHNGAASDGANNAHFFPGQFYDYLWGTTLARQDYINTQATDPRASGPDGNGGLNHVPGDFRELQGTMWFHDHRFFFTAENVYKGHLGMTNYYSGPDRGNEELEDGVNHRLPSGTLLDWGNVDFDINLMIADMAFDQNGQYFFDIFDTDGFLGDLLHVNFAYRPYFEVLPRKYRLRTICACMSRFLKLCLVDESGNKVPFDFIANDGNFLVNPVRNLTEMDQQGVAERFDIVVDFSRFQVGDRIKFVNLLEHKDGRGPDKRVSLAEALSGEADDPAVGHFMEFRVVDQVESVDVPGVFHNATDPDPSQVPDVLTEQIPVEEPVRVREIEFKRGGNASDLFDPSQCMPECGEKTEVPWTIRINGEDAHFLNANRVNLLVPKPGEVEHWVLKNGGGGWDHPIHLHFEEGITLDRGGDSIPATERLVRKDVWRLRESGEVRIQVKFSEFGGAYVSHCHNTVHEDFAMLARYDVLTEQGGPGSQTHVEIIPTPNPRPEGVEYLTPDILPEGDPRSAQLKSLGGGSRRRA